MPAGNATITRLLRASLSPATPLAQTLLQSNTDGTYLLTLTSSLATELVISLSLGGRKLADARATVLPAPPEPSCSQVVGTDSGTLQPAESVQLTAGRAYEFYARLFDAFGNRAAESEARWVLGARLVDDAGEMQPVTRLSQSNKRCCSLSSSRSAIFEVHGQVSLPPDD